MGWNVERLASWRVPEALRGTDEPVLFAEGLTAPMMADELGLMLIEPAQDWLPQLPFGYRLRDVRATTMCEARKIKSPAFIKPPNDKSFAAKVYTAPELPTDYADEMPVLVSEIVEWEIEFRCFILDREIRTFSIYLRHGELQREAGFSHSASEEVELLSFMNRLLTDTRIQLPVATVIDAGIIHGRGWAVIEQNAAWASGI